MKKKKENFNHTYKRTSGYLAYRKYKYYKYTMHDLLEYRKLQDWAMKVLKDSEL